MASVARVVGIGHCKYPKTAPVVTNLPNRGKEAGDTGTAAPYFYRMQCAFVSICASILFYIFTLDADVNLVNQVKKITELVHIIHDRMIQLK